MNATDPPTVDVEKRIADVVETGVRRIIDPDATRRHPYTPSIADTGSMPKYTRNSAATT